MCTHMIESNVLAHFTRSDQVALTQLEANNGPSWSPMICDVWPGNLASSCVHYAHVLYTWQIDLDFEVACAFIVQSLFEGKQYECRSFSSLKMYLTIFTRHEWSPKILKFTRASFYIKHLGSHALPGWPTSLDHIVWWCLVSKWWQIHPWDLFLHLLRRGVGEGIRVANGGVCLSGFGTVKSQVLLNFDWSWHVPRSEIFNFNFKNVAMNWGWC